LKGKFYQGLSTKLPSTKTAGSLYFLTDTQEIYLDSDSSTRTRVGKGSISKSDVTTALGYTPPTTNTTYNVVSKTAAGLVPQLPNETTTTKYLRQDGT
jgi:hypothetical protein